MIIGFAYILSVILVSAVMSIYGYWYVSILTLLTMAICGLIFLVCHFTEKHKLIGGIALLGIFILGIILIVVFSNIGQEESNLRFWQWVLNKDDDTEVVLAYIISLNIAASIFLSSTIYYFSKVQYRLSFLTLVSLIPCVLYIKVTAELDNIYLVLIAGFNMAIHVARHYYTSRDVKKKGNFFALSGMMTFGFIVLMLCSIIPKEEEARYYETFENIFLNGDTTSQVSGGFSDNTDFSGNADTYSKTKNRRLYTIYANEIVYMKRQTFDLYDFESNRWFSAYKDNEETYSENEWADYQELLKISDLQNALEKASRYNPDFGRKYSGLIGKEKISDPKRKIGVTAQNFNAGYFLSSTRGVNIVGGSKRYVANGAAAFNILDGTHGEYDNYSLYYLDSKAIDSWIRVGGANYNDNATASLLEELIVILRANSDPSLECAQAFLEQHKKAIEYRRLVANNTSEIPKEIVELANTITRGLEYDYEKAKAIEGYFHSGEFTYDLKYVAEDDSPEYFLFEGKIGTCSDFASAYVLLARAAGLTVRYVEGYVPKEEITGTYFITDRCGHAYPEVYIQNAGWKIYEPTISGTVDEEQTFDFFEFLERLRVDYGLFFVLFVAAVIISSLFTFIKVFIPFFVEVGFRIRIHFIPVSQCAVLCYRRMVKKASKKKKIKKVVDNQDIDFKSLTPMEFENICSEAQIDIKEFIGLLQRQEYETEVLDKKDRKILLKGYRKL